MKVYVPQYNNGNCVSVYNNNTIRVYDSTPTQNSTINYKEYYINSSYLSHNGSSTFNNYTTLPTCVSSNDITTNVFYRLDIDKILVCTFILLIICFYFPYRIISRLFGRWLKW